jgi:hypothetical protein
LQRNKQNWKTCYDGLCICANKRCNCLLRAPVRAASGRSLRDELDDVMRQHHETVKQSCFRVMRLRWVPVCKLNRSKFIAWTGETCVMYSSLVFCMPCQAGWRCSLHVSIDWGNIPTMYVSWYSLFVAKKTSMFRWSSMDRLLFIVNHCKAFKRGHGYAQKKMAMQQNESTEAIFN